MTDKLKAEVEVETVVPLTEVEVETVAPLTEVEVETVAPLTEVEVPESEVLLTAAKAKAAPLIDRLAAVEAALTKLDSQATPVEGGASVLLDDEIKARKAAAAKRNDLLIEQDVVRERLDPIQAEVEALVALVEAERLTAERAKVLAEGLAALARIAEAREALEVQIVALAVVARNASIRWNALPDIHFAVQAEAEALGSTMRSFGMASA